MLTMHRGKGAVRFDWTDGDVESSVSLLPEDDEESLVRKLKRVIALVEGPQPKPGFAMMGPLIMDDEYARQGLVPPVTGNGWATPAPVAPPELPEDRQGDWELIPPGEVSDGV